MFYFVHVSRYLGALEKSWKNILKISAPEASTRPKEGHRAARGVPGALLVRPPLAAPGGLMGWSHIPWCPTCPPILTLGEETPKHKSLFRSTPRSRRHPPFFLGRANLEAVLASGEAKSSPSPSPSPLHHPSMTSPLMCE